MEFVKYGNMLLSSLTALLFDIIILEEDSHGEMCMKIIRQFGLLCLPFLCTCMLFSGCNFGQLNIRIKNTSISTFEDVKANGISFGEVKSGQISSYKAVSMNKIPLEVIVFGILVRGKKESYPAQLLPTPKGTELSHGCYTMSISGQFPTGSNSSPTFSYELTREECP